MKDKKAMLPRQQDQSRGHALYHNEGFHGSLTK